MIDLFGLLTMRPSRIRLISSVRQSHTIELIPIKRANRVQQMSQGCRSPIMMTYGGRRPSVVKKEADEREEINGVDAVNFGA